MLSELELSRLNDRETVPPKVRAINDMRVKKKLVTWLDDTADVLTIFQSIPSEKLKNDLSDVDVYRLLTLAGYIMFSRKFMPVSGKLETPEAWQVEGNDTTRPANRNDIGRSILVNEYLRELEEHVGVDNPAVRGAFLGRLPKEPYWDRFTPDEKIGIEKALQCRAEYHRILTEKQEEPK